jgi:hypothetical protein
MRIAKKYLSTEEGLVFAKTIAEQLGLDFDREGTRAEADDMHELYFAAIVRTAGLDPGLMRFRSAAYRSLNSNVPFTPKAKGSIFFDEQLDPWLLTSTVLLTIKACKPLEANEVAAFVSAFVSNLDVPAKPFLHERNRKRLRGFMCRHPDTLEVAVPLRRAMVVFILCHEIGHILADHRRQKTNSNPALEKEADERGAELYSTICRSGLAAHPVSIHPKLAAAPILMMEYFALLERRHRQLGIASENAETHPSAISRSKRSPRVLKVGSQ